MKDAKILALDWDVPEFVLQMRPIRTYRNLDWDKEKKLYLDYMIRSKQKLKKD